MHFYALQEGDDDLFHDIYLAHERAYDPAEFFELVQEIRRRVQVTFEDDTLVEAIADGLEREHGFIALTDDRIDAAVQVSSDEDGNRLIDLDDLGDGADYRAVFADWDPETGQPG